MNKQLAEALVREGLVTDEQVRAANDIWDLAKLGFVDEATLALQVSRFFDVEIVDLDTYRTPQNVFAMLPAEMARLHSVVPIAVIGANLVLATSDPGNLTELDAVKFLTGYNVQPVVAPPGSIAAAIARVYDATPAPVDVMSAAFDKDIAEALAAVPGRQLRLDVCLHEGPIDVFVNKLLEHGMRSGTHSLRFSPRGEDAVMTRRSASGVDERAFPLALLRPLCARIVAYSGQVFLDETWWSTTLFRMGATTEMLAVVFGVWPGPSAPEVWIEFANPRAPSTLVGGAGLIVDRLMHGIGYTLRLEPAGELVTATWSMIEEERWPFFQYAVAVHAEVVRRLAQEPLVQTRQERDVVYVDVRKHASPFRPILPATPPDRSARATGIVEDGGLHHAAALALVVRRGDTSLDEIIAAMAQCGADTVVLAERPAVSQGMRAGRVWIEPSSATGFHRARHFFRGRGVGLDERTSTRMSWIESTPAARVTLEYDVDIRGTCIRHYGSERPTRSLTDAGDVLMAIQREEGFGPADELVVAQREGRCEVIGTSRVDPAPRTLITFPTALWGAVTAHLGVFGWRARADGTLMTELRAPMRGAPP